MNHLTPSENANALGNVISRNTKLIQIIVLAVVAGLLAKIPFYFEMREDYFYNKNLGFILFPLLMIYFGWFKKLSKTASFIVLGILGISAVYMNILPYSDKDSTILAGMHMFLFTWSILGFVYTGNEYNSMQKRISFLKFNADLLVLSALIMIASMILTAMSFGLFQLIDIDIEKFYTEHVIVHGLAAMPIIAAYIVNENPNLVGKITPLIAKIFSPIVFVLLFIYLIAIIFSGKNPYNDRDFLIIFNVLIIGVLALVLFSIVGSTQKNKFELWILYALTVLTIIVNLVALSAIIFRINELGFTPNRTAVLGSNLLILTHLIIVNISLFKVASNKSELLSMEENMAKYLPVYACWAAFVAFLFPLIFGY